MCFPRGALAKRWVKGRSRSRAGANRSLLCGAYHRAAGVAALATRASPLAQSSAVPLNKRNKVCSCDGRGVDLHVHPWPFARDDSARNREGS